MNIYSGIRVDFLSQVLMMKFSLMIDIGFSYLRVICWYISRTLNEWDRSGRFLHMTRFIVFPEFEKWSLLPSSDDDEVIAWMIFYRKSIRYVAIRYDIGCSITICRLERFSFTLCIVCEFFERWMMHMRKFEGNIIDKLTFETKRELHIDRIFEFFMMILYIFMNIVLENACNLYSLLSIKTIFIDDKVCRLIDTIRNIGNSKCLKSSYNTKCRDDDSCYPERKTPIWKSDSGSKKYSRLCWCESYFTRKLFDIFTRLWGEVPMRLDMRIFLKQERLQNLIMRK